MLVTTSTLPSASAGIDPKRVGILGFSAGGRNIALVIGALGASVPEDTWLFFAVLQFPIYCLPAVLKPAYDRMLTPQ